MLTTVLGQLPAFLTMGAGGGAGFYGLRWLVMWFTGRIDKRQEALDDQQEALNQGWAQYRHALEERLAGYAARIAELEREVRDCATRELEWMATAKRLEAILQGLGEGHAEVQRRASAEILKMRQQSGKE